MIPYFSLSQIQLGPISLAVWGLMASLGYLAGLLISLKEAERRNMDKELVWDGMFIALFSMILGSKIFYILFSSDPLNAAFLLVPGGFSLIGGMIFGLIAVFLYAKMKKADFWVFADVLTPGFAVALVLIRIGCFLSYEHVGGITALPWKEAYLDGAFRHPVSLYLILNNVVILLVIWYLKRRNIDKIKGAIFLSFITYYSISRFILDLTRCSDLSICEERFYGLTYTQLLMLAVFPLASCYLYKLLKNKIKL